MSDDYAEYLEAQVREGFRDPRPWPAVRRSLFWAGMLIAAGLVLIVISR